MEGVGHRTKIQKGVQGSWPGFRHCTQHMYLPTHGRSKGDERKKESALEEWLIDLCVTLPKT